jgi:hypothetical protein
VRQQATRHVRRSTTFFFQNKPFTKPSASSIFFSKTNQYQQPATSPQSNEQAEELQPVGTTSIVRIR